jgi:hypothetical protein
MSKLNRHGDPVGELRQDILKHVLDVADAKAASETKRTGVMVYRTDIINSVLVPWADSIIDEAILIVNLTKVIPYPADKGESL